MVNRKRLFYRKYINAQVIALNKKILNSLRNYVPNKYIIVNDKGPVWMNETTKSKCKTRNEFFVQYIQSGRFQSDFLFLESLTIEINELISSTKVLFYENLVKNLNNPLLQAKTYSSIIQTFGNDKKWRLFHLF